MRLRWCRPAATRSVVTFVAFVTVVMCVQTGGTFALMHDEVEATATVTHTTQTDDAATTTHTMPVLEPSRPEETGRVRQLRFGEKLKLDDLGPVIVNDDCTLRRIENWDSLSVHERSATMRRIGGRNQDRLSTCRRLEAEGKLQTPDVFVPEPDLVKSEADEEPDIDALLGRQQHDGL